MNSLATRVKPGGCMRSAGGARAPESDEMLEGADTARAEGAAGRQGSGLSGWTTGPAALEGDTHALDPRDESVSLAYAEARRPYLETDSPIPSEAFRLRSWRYFVEINTGCNLRCAMCIRSDRKSQGHANAIMDHSLLERVLDKIKVENSDAHVCLYGNSEPFLHARLPECVTAVKTRGLFCLLSTNLNIVRNLKETLESGPDIFIVSVSGFTQDVYGRAHRGGNIERVKANMRTLAETRAEIGSTVPILVHYHLYRDNWGDEFDRMKEFSEALGFAITTSWARSISMEKTIQYLRLRDRQTRGSVPPMTLAVGPDQNDRGTLLDDVTEDFLSDIARLGISPDEATGFYGHYPVPSVCPVGDLFTFVRHDGRVSLCGCVSDSRLTLGHFLDQSQDDLCRLRRGHPLCRECLRYKMNMYFHIVDTPMWDRIMARKFPAIPADRRKV
jgi:pyruvate-formate lyase-activating enzyme